MKYFKTRLLVLCGFMVLAAAFLAPAVAEAQCPLWGVNCGNSMCTCAGIPQGTNCSYDMACMNGGCCKRDDDDLPIDY
jgi:hypothetical protein